MAAVVNGRIPAPGSSTTRPWLTPCAGSPAGRRVPSSDGPRRITISLPSP